MADGRHLEISKTDTSPERLTDQHKIWQGDT